MTLLLLAGEMGSGKTTTAREVCQILPARLLSVREHLSQLFEVDSSNRAEMQERGALLEITTEGRWVADLLRDERWRVGPVVVDALRTIQQGRAVLAAFPSAQIVYLEAGASVRQARYEAAADRDGMKRKTDFKSASHHPTEERAAEVRELATVVIQNESLELHEVVSRVIDLVSTVED